MVCPGPGKSLEEGDDGYRTEAWKFHSIISSWDSDAIMTKYWQVYHNSTPENMCASNFGGLPYYPTPLHMRAGQRKEVLVMES